MRMESLECPYTWGFGIMTTDTARHKDHDGEGIIPVIKLMRKLMIIYIDSQNIETSGGEDQKLILDLLKCETLLSAIENSDMSQNISHNVVHHVVQATRAFVYSKLGMTVEMEEVLQKIEKIDFSDRKAKNTLTGCKAICWAKYAQSDSGEAENLIREALDEDPNCHLWHFVLGRILRNKRRDFNFGSLPSDEEEKAFKTAYSMLSTNPVYGTFLAQMLREKKLKRDAFEIYVQVFEKRPKSNAILLRLALGFMAAKEMEKARQCLDKVSESPLNNRKKSMFLHYEGIYHFKLKRYEVAAKFLLDAAKDNNLGADYQYIECILKVDEYFNVTKYLFKMIDRYDYVPPKKKQRILLDLAVSYWRHDENIEDSLKYFLEAIKIDPKSEIFTNYTPYQIGLTLSDPNIFRVLENDLLRIVYANKYSSRETLEMAHTLREYCAEHQADRFIA